LEYERVFSALAQLCQVQYIESRKQVFNILEGEGNT